MMKRALLIFSLMFLAAATLAQFSQAKSSTTSVLTITVGTTQKQQFLGFGVSEMNDAGRFQQLSPAVREAVSKMVWQDLNFKILRLWFNPTHYIADPNNPSLAEFKADFIDSGMLDLAKKQGCNTLLLAPNDVPPQFASGAAGSGGFATFSDAGVKAYAALLATAIKQMHDELGVDITATGVLNEPNDRPIRFTLPQWPVMIQSLRAELDSRGLTAVQIISPEAASCDDTAYGMVDAIKAVPAAWSKLNGIATHSYNMAATDDMVGRITGEGKTYWQTESSTPGPENLGDIDNAATTSATIISDLNHGVTHWVYFIGYEQDDPTDNGTRLIKYDANAADGAIAKLYKYCYVQQLSQAFPPGSVAFQCTSSMEDTMTWTYGTKPTILTAAAKRPDGTWAIAIQNYTSKDFTSSALSGWDRSQGGQTGRTITLTLKIGPLATGAPTTFNVFRSDGQSQNVSAGTVTVSGGTVTMTLAPLQLITLTGVPPVTNPTPPVIPPVTPPTTVPTTPPTPPPVTPPTTVPTTPPVTPPTTVPSSPYPVWPWPPTQRRRPGRR